MTIFSWISANRSELDIQHITTSHTWLCKLYYNATLNIGKERQHRDTTAEDKEESYLGRSYTFWSRGASSWRPRWCEQWGGRGGGGGGRFTRIPQVPRGNCPGRACQARNTWRRTHPRSSQDQTAGMRGEGLRAVAVTASLSPDWILGQVESFVVEEMVAIIIWLFTLGNSYVFSMYNDFITRPFY